ncbi:Mov34/MPN/PAD-1 family protein [Promineifilum sp.]|uniref:Mov34/MPN/PAD-1 family protein n=1 Tax=Promineifilum sp. TaxID=2664178 RepID=UPI0035B3AC69
MTDHTDVTYAAQITLKLPGQDETASLTVTLAPADRIPVGGRAKPLSECTLAELRAYGDALEADVWDTYQAITLHQLQEEARVEIAVTALDEQGRAVDEVEEWVEHAIILVEPPAETAPEPADETTPAPVAETEAAEAQPEPEPQPEPPPAPPPPVEPAVVEAAKPEAPTIIPSQARVRVAGERLPLAASGGAAVDILLDEAPLRAMQAHALSSLDREVAGVMIGRRPEKQPDGRYVVHVIDSIIAKHTVMHGASVTYTPESWRYLNDTLWERYPDESAVMVGWYHTHPGFGIFLSGMDLFIHQNFFTQIWHVAYVLDPRARTSGFFCWNRQKTKVNRYDFPWPDWAANSW